MTAAGWAFRQRGRGAPDASGDTRSLAAEMCKWLRDRCRGVPSLRLLEIGGKSDAASLGRRRVGEFADG